MSRQALHSGWDHDYVALVSTGEAAAAIGVNETTLQRWAHQGKVRPAYRTPGGHFRWDIVDLMRQLRAEIRPERKDEE
jgi:excisionase family DNA binding protein